MGTFHRFSLFFLGIFLGVIILFFSLSLRDGPISFNYFPNSRVISYMAKNNINFYEKSHCKMKCCNLDSIELNYFISNSKVNFKKSIIRNKNLKLYHLSYNDFNFLIEKRNDSLFFKDIVCNKRECLDCN
ncbi:MAG: hypothetical protein CMP65_05740 [Flavobacteriales bacterium]|nr:hypothetical protein [Flavobacteriales bacterium]